LYRYFENIKKKNKIIKNINSDKPINVKLDKPINYSEKFEQSEKSIDTIYSNISGVSGISKVSGVSRVSIPAEDKFGKDVERNLQMGNLQENRKVKLARPDVQGGCANINNINKNDNYFEPMANNAFSDNFLDYNLL
jgi:hypothetical protein